MEIISNEFKHMITTTSVVGLNVKNEMKKEEKENEMKKEENEMMMKW